MTEYSYTHLNVPAKIAFVSSPVVGFHTEVITRFAHHPSRKVFQVCSIEHILWTRQSLNQGKVFTLSCICSVWFVYFHKFTFLWIRRERGEEGKINPLILSHLFKLRGAFCLIFWTCQQKRLTSQIHLFWYPWGYLGLGVSGKGFQSISFIESIHCI